MVTLLTQTDANFSRAFRVLFCLLFFRGSLVVVVVVVVEEHQPWQSLTNWRLSCPLPARSLFTLCWCC